MTRISSVEMSAQIIGTTFGLDVTRAVITHDETWAPSVQVQLTCALGDPALIAAVDPRKDVQITFTVVQSYGRTDTLAVLSAESVGETLANLSAEDNGKTLAQLTAERYYSWSNPGGGYEAPTVRTMKLSLRGRSINHGDETITLSCASEEALLQDDAHIGTYVLYPDGAKVFNIVDYCLSRLGRILSDVNATAQDALVSFDLRGWKPGVTAHDYLYQQVRKSGLILWADEVGVWHLRDRRPFIETIATIDATDNMVDAEDEISRDKDWYTAVVLTYHWTDDTGTHEAYDSYFTTAFPARVFTETRDIPFPGTGMAEALCRTFVAQGRVNSVTAVADYTLRLGQRVNVLLPATPAQLGTIAAVTWRFPEDQMTVRTRESIDY